MHMEVNTAKEKRHFFIWLSVPANLWNWTYFDGTFIGRKLINVKSNEGYFNK